jgi:hypothetical protein
MHGIFLYSYLRFKFYGWKALKSHSYFIHFYFKKEADMVLNKYKHQPHHSRKDTQVFPIFFKSPEFLCLFPEM